MKRKAQMTLAAVVSASLMLVLLAITLVVGQDIQGEMRTGASNTGYLYNASIDSSEGIDKLSNWQKTIGLVIGAGAVITIVVVAFAAMRMR